MGLVALLAVSATVVLWDSRGGGPTDGSGGLPGWLQVGSQHPSASGGGKWAPPTDGPTPSAARGGEAKQPGDGRPGDGQPGDGQRAGGPPAGGAAWALWTARSGTVVGSANRNSWTNSTESMIKPWIVADFLRRLGPRQPTDDQRTDAVRAIVHSDDEATQRLYLAGGADAVVNRMIDMCRLTDTRITRAQRWSYTHLTATDAVRMGRCVADGRAAGPTWTPWVLDQMRRVTGTVDEEPNGGRWGILDALPAQTRAGVAIKNGWTSIKADGMWHLNCLAATDRWVLSVLTRYPAEWGKRYGARLCRDRTTRLLNTGALVP